jgi:hypothetical protein
MRSMIRRASVAAIALGIILASPVAATTPVGVPADAGWVSSGVTVEAGVPVAVATHGYVQTAFIPAWHVPGVFKSASGPAGQTTEPTCGEVYATWTPELQAETGPCVLGSAFWGELIAKVGADGTPFRVGETSSITPPATGVLYFTVGELRNTYWDNRGAFTVLFK